MTGSAETFVIKEEREVYFRAPARIHDATSMSDFFNKSPQADDEDLKAEVTRRMKTITTEVETMMLIQKAREKMEEKTRDEFQGDTNFGTLKEVLKKVDNENDDDDDDDEL